MKTLVQRVTAITLFVMAVGISIVPAISRASISDPGPNPTTCSAPPDAVDPGEYTPGEPIIEEES